VHTVEDVPVAVADSRSTICGSVRPCALGRHPKPRLPRRPNCAIVREEIPTTVPRSRSFAEMFSNKAPSDDVSAKSSRRPSPKLSRDEMPWVSGGEFSREAPACGEPAATSKSRFRRSKRYAHADAGRFFYSRPLLAQPSPHFAVVPLAGLPLRFLRRNATLGQPLIEIMRMKLFAECSLNQFGHARGAPKIGGKAELPRRATEPRQNLPFLLRGEPWRSSRVRFCFQACRAAFSIRLRPTLNASRMNVEEIRHFLLRIAQVETFDGQSPSTLQLGWCSFRYHKILYA